MSTNRFYGTGNFDGDMRNVLILSPYIQTKENARVDEIDFDHTLVVDIDTLSNDIADQLKSMADNPIAQQSKLLIEYLSGKSFRNSDRVLHWLQSTGNIQKLPAEKVALNKTMGGHTMSVINNIIRGEMASTESSTGIDVDTYRKEQAKEYHKKLNEEQYPDFGNPSENGKIDEAAPIPADVPLPPGVEPVNTETSGVDNKVVDIDAKSLHSSIVEEIRSNQEKVQEAVSVMSKFEDVLSSSVVDSMVGTLKQYASRTEDTLKDEIIDILAEHFEYVDSDYIKRNLEAAEKRLSKKSEE